MPSTRKGSAALTRIKSLPDAVQRQIFLDIENSALQGKSPAQLVAYKPDIYGNPEVEADAKKIKASRDRIRFLRTKREQHPAKYL